MEEISKSFQGIVLFDRVNFQVHAGDRIGLIGANGCGKTTLLRILAGRLEPDEGCRKVKKGLCVGMIDQLPEYGDETVLEAARRSFGRLYGIERRLEELDRLLAEEKSSSRLEKLLLEQDQLLEEFERLGGYSMEANLEKVLRGVGFRVEEFSKRVPVLSGGEKRRLAFASLLLSHPDVLLLDEPTNHLDIEAIEWVERYLQEYEGAMVVVSHDRMFLDRVCQKTVEILGGKLHLYSGNYSFYEQERQVRYQLALKAYQAQQEEIARQEEIIRRLHANPKLNVAQSRRRQLEKIERLEKPIPPPKGARFRFTNRNPQGNLAIECLNVSHRYGDRVLFENLTLRLEPGERFAIVGPNGAGKTTLMKILARQLPPTSGEVRYGKTTTFAYYSQEREDLPLNSSVLQLMQETYPKEDRSKLQDFLALFLFTEEDWDKKVHQLSGGERSKLSLARILYSEPNLLALDEPTNHLDIPTCRNLEDALVDFPGTLIFVSHDRYFINKLASHILYIKDGKVKDFLGNYHDLEQKLKRQEKSLQKDNQKASLKKSEKNVLPTKPTEVKKKKYKGTFRQLEEEIIRLEEHLEQLHHQLSLPEVYRNGQKAKQIKEDCERTKSKLDELNQFWEEEVC